MNDDANSNDAIMSAKRAYIATGADGRKIVVFENGTSYRGKPGTLDYVITDFSSYNSRVKQKEKTSHISYASFVPTLSLLDGSSHYTTELHWRLAPVISALLTPILALMIAMRVQGSKWYFSLVIGLGVFFIYQNCLGVMRSLLRNDDIPLLLGLWPIHLFFVLSLIGLYRHLQHGYLFKLGVRTI